MKSRLIAFLIHLAISFFIAAIALVLVFYVWYPTPLADAFGVTQIFLLLLGVDVTLGPSLTFLVYQKDKKSLPFDLTVIALVQIAALSYGMTTIFQGRPAYIVFSNTRFEAIRVVETNDASRKIALAADNPLANASWFGPKWIAAVPAKDMERRNEILFSSLQGGPDLAQMPELYVPLADLKSRILDKSSTLPELRSLHDNSNEVNKKLSGLPDNTRWLPLKGKAKDMVVLIDAQSAAVLKIIDINPWP